MYSEEESTGSCELLAGENACPPEDSRGMDGMGNSPYNKFLKTLPPKDQWNGPKSAKLYSKVKSALREAGDSLNVKKALFDPYHFDLEAHRRALATALASRASCKSGAKMFNIPIHDTGGEYDVKGVLSVLNVEGE